MPEAYAAVPHTTEDYSTTTPVFRDIPDHLKGLKLWIVWEIPVWKRGQEKPKKIPRTPDGKGYPTKGFAERKEFGTFAEVEAACKSNPRFYPGIWLTDVPGLVCLDYDAHPDGGPIEVPPYDSYTEYSVYWGFHVFCYLKDGTVPNLPKDVDVRSNSWVVMTGNTVKQRLVIRDLTDELCKPKEEIILLDDDTTPKKEPVKLTADATSRHPEFKKIVTSGVANNFTFEMILSSCQIANKDFPVPKTKEQVEREVVSLFDWATTKQILKAGDKKKKDAERTIILPGGIITPLMKEILDRHHPNVAIAHCLNTLIGTDNKDGGTVRWNTDQQAWFVWDGRVWQKEPDGLSVVKYAEGFLFRAMEDAAKSKNESFLKRLLSCQGIGNIRGAMGFLQGMTAVKDDVFDTDDNLFNIKNGTLDLRTGEILSFDKTNFITRIGHVEYKKDADCPAWDAHLALVIPDKETRHAFQSYMGYTLVAGNGENTALFLYGGGKNGKTETVLTVADIFGTYTLNAQAATFYIRKYDDQPRPDIARLKGPRFITIPEGAQGKVIDEGLLKQLTGGDVVTARFLYGREFDFIPKGKLVFFTSHLPKIQGRDPGIWRRIFPVPFEQTVPKDKRIRDYHKILIEKEGPGILNWLLRGLQIYREKGLVVSSAIKEAKGTYKAREDVLAEFMDKYVITESRDDVILRADLYVSYKLWAGADQTTKTFPKTKFNMMIEERVGAAIQVHNVGWCWTGIRVLKADEEVEQRTIDNEW